MEYFPFIWILMVGGVGAILWAALEGDSVMGWGGVVAFIASFVLTAVVS